MKKHCQTHNDYIEILTEVWITKSVKWNIKKNIVELYIKMRIYMTFMSEFFFSIQCAMLSNALQKHIYL